MISKSIIQSKKEKLIAFIYVIHTQINLDILIRKELLNGATTYSLHKLSHLILRSNSQTITYNFCLKLLIFCLLIDSKVVV